MRVQNENPGNYSCLGSINFEDSSKFGDCAWTDNRIWLFLGNDNQPPQVEISYPYVAHTVKVTIEAEDISTISEFKYCIDDDDTCTPNIIIPGSGTTFQLSCDYDYGCLKYVRYTAKDSQGNEASGSKELTLIDKGSSCQADCTAKPKPNRYLKECRKINDCEYYNYNNAGQMDNGEYVADICHMRAQGAYAPFNNTHEIQCPEGPFRRSTFTALKMKIASECNHLISNTYPVRIEGKNVNLMIYSCLN
jgi:hypothetical protein